ncbi:ABC transporter ATP-binding protein [Pseudobacteriovorax antillogorgiicola]|nr:ABC transporter ATP-binding protein [Pseudobacteriovorax antillogorgiicola]
MTLKVNKLVASPHGVILACKGYPAYLVSAQTGRPQVNEEFDMSALIEVNALGFSYGSRDFKHELFDGLNLNIQAGEFIGLTGPSGSGKSTLLNILGLIESIQHGDVRLMGESLKSASEDRKNYLRLNTLGFIFQDFHLMNTLTVLENVQFFASLQGLDERQARLRALLALRRVGMLKHYRKKPFELSGGQRQRVAIARALAKRPQVLIADEPTASLDQDSGTVVMETLRYLNEALGVTIIVASHDSIIDSYVQRTIHMVDGVIVDHGGAHHAAEVFAT